MGKKPIVSVTYENERISIKNSLPYLKCLLRLSFYGFLCKQFSLYINCKPVSIKHGLQTADYGLRTGYKIRTRYKTRIADCGLGIKYGLLW